MNTKTLLIITIITTLILTGCQTQSNEECLEGLATQMCGAGSQIHTKNFNVEQPTFSCIGNDGIVDQIPRQFPKKYLETCNVENTQ